jgi:hypothetical protein
MPVVLFITLRRKHKQCLERLEPEMSRWYLPNWDTSPAGQVLSSAATFWYELKKVRDRCRSLDLQSFAQYSATISTATLHFLCCNACNASQNSVIYRWRDKQPQPDLCLHRVIGGIHASGRQQSFGDSAWGFCAVPLDRLSHGLYSPQLPTWFCP